MDEVVDEGVTEYNLLGILTPTFTFAPTRVIIAISLQIDQLLSETFSERKDGAASPFYWLSNVIPLTYYKQAPKTVPNQTKQNTILAYLQSSLTVHSIKDLEKSIPSVAGINGMQVKDFLQALSDEGLIRVEKIGSGNWYWSFASEAKKERTDTMAKLREEKGKIDASLGELTVKVNEANAIRGRDPDRASLIDGRLALENEVEGLKKELEGYKDGDPGEVERRRKEIKAYQMKAERWTDNIGILEGQMLTAIGGDREKLDGIKREIYGDEYAEGEGLREL